jgi:UDP-glucose 4-epimerase
VRDYVHVIDLAQAHILALHALEKGSRTYNLGQRARLQRARCGGKGTPP